MVVTGEQAEGPAVMERWLEDWAPRSPACGRGAPPLPLVGGPQLGPGQRQTFPAMVTGPAWECESRG